jgi:hypothetical protein
MDEGRPLVDGAALFWTLPRRRSVEVLRLLVTFQTLLNVMDVVLERDAVAVGRPRPWTRLVRDALDITRPPPTTNDLAMLPGVEAWIGDLVVACRDGCRRLPGYAQAHAILARETARAVSFEIEHDTDHRRRRRDMINYSARHFAGEETLTPWELTGGASSLMTAMAVLAYAGEGDVSTQELARFVRSWLRPWRALSRPRPRKAIDSTPVLNRRRSRRARRRRGAALAGRLRGGPAAGARPCDGLGVADGDRGARMVVVQPGLA